MKRDPEKAERNLRKHKVGFEEARTVFDDLFLLTYPDPDHSANEQRYFNIGVSDRGRVLVVIHTERDSGIRIISCRKATSSEQRVYATSVQKHTAPDVRSRTRQMVELSIISRSGSPSARARRMTGTVDEAQVTRLIRKYGPIEREHHALRVSAESEKWWRDVRARGRQSEVILALQRPEGRVLLHTKSFYPPGAYRLTSGGVKPGEKIVKAARREGYEELGLKIRIERFLGVIEYAFQHGDETIPFASYVFLVSGDGEPHPTDLDERISGYREVSWTDLPAIADALEAVPPDWIDWGRFRAIGHRFVGRLVQDSNPTRRGLRQLQTPNPNL